MNTRLQASPRRVLFRSLAIALTWSARAVMLVSARAEESAAGDLIELPSLLVESSLPGIVWEHARTENFDILSAASKESTEIVANQMYASRRLLSVLVPVDLQLQTSLPEAVMIYPNRLRSRLGQELTKELDNAAREAGKWAPNLALAGRDLVAHCYLVDEAVLPNLKFRLLPSYVRLLLERRSPALPDWFIDSFCSIFDASRLLGRTSVVTGPFTWISSEETAKIARNPKLPIAMLSPSEILGGKSRPASSDPSAQLWKSEAELFVRWALSGKASRQKAFWAWVRRPVDASNDEAAFRKIFGLGWEDLRERLTDYLPTAVKEEYAMPVPGAFNQPAEATAANAADIARIKGEWEYLSSEYVKRRAPGLASRYLEQARLTVKRGYEATRHAPDLAALLGLVEVAAGDPSGARSYLEIASAAPRMRPRAAVELALLDYLSVREKGKKIDGATTKGLLARLASARHQSPPLPEAYALTGEVLLNSEISPQPEDLAALQEGADFFPTHGPLVLQAALLNQRGGNPAAALRLARLGSRFAAEKSIRVKLEQLASVLE